MQYKLAQVISTILNPLVILFFLPFFLVFETTNSLEKSVYWTIVSSVFLVGFSIFILMGIRFKYFSDLDISKRNQRPLLYTVAILYSIVFLFTLFILNAPRVLAFGTIGLLLGLSINEIINRFTKSSIHVAAITGLVTLLVLIEGIEFSILYFLVLLVAWARIKTKNHTFNQTIIGALTTFFITILIFVIFKYIIK